MENRELYERIERYFSGAMDSGEKASFESLMNSDKTVANEAAAYKELMKSFGVYSSRKKLKSTLNVLHADVEKETTTQERPVKIRAILGDTKFWSAAASVALLISVGTFLVMNYVNSFGGKDKAYYRELRRDIDRVQSSHNKIIKQLNEDKLPAQQASFGGTAIAISSDGYVLTSYHVVKDVESVYIENKKFSRLKLKKVYTDPRLDLVILKVEDDSFSTFGPLPFIFRNKGMDLGEKVYTLGYPKKDVVYGEGYISSINGYDGDTASYQIAVPVNPGQSGGPLFDEQGNLVGIVSGKHTENESSAFAVKAEYLRKTILTSDSLSAKIKLTKYNSMRNQGRVQMIKKVQDYVFEVKGYN